MLFFLETLDIPTPKDFTLQNVKDLFPYAVAFGLQDKWTKRFKNESSSLLTEKTIYDRDFQRSFSDNLFRSSKVPGSGGSSSGGSSGGGCSGGGDVYGLFAATQDYHNVNSHAQGLNASATGNIIINNTGNGNVYGLHSNVYYEFYNVTGSDNATAQGLITIRNDGTGNAY